MWSSVVLRNIYFFIMFIFVGVVYRAIENIHICMQLWKIFMVCIFVLLYDSISYCYLFIQFGIIIVIVFLFLSLCKKFFKLPLVSWYLDMGFWASKMAQLMNSLYCMHLVKLISMLTSSHATFSLHNPLLLGNNWSAIVSAWLNMKVVMRWY